MKPPDSERPSEWTPGRDPPGLSHRRAHYRRKPSTRVAPTAQPRTYEQTTEGFAIVRLSKRRAVFGRQLPSAEPQGTLILDPQNTTEVDDAVANDGRATKIAPTRIMLDATSVVGSPPDAPPPEHVGVSPADTSSTSGLPPAVQPPEHVGVWTADASSAAVPRLGSFSHVGPTEIKRDKGNQDFAFHIEQKVDGRTWALFGVADGVGQATWSSRAARHAAAGFVEGMNDFFLDATFPRDEKQLEGNDWSWPLAEKLYERISRRLDEDSQTLLDGQFVDPTWSRDAFFAHFHRHERSAEHVRSKWFQTTLLAVMLGPYGGIALFLGDGFARIDRQFEDGHWDSDPGLNASPAISMDLSAQQVHSGVVRLLPRQAKSMGILVATDGVSDSSDTALAAAMKSCEVLEAHEQRPPLERVLLSSSSECERILEHLARQPAELAARDNMSLAFATYRLKGGAE